MCVLCYCMSMGCCLSVWPTSDSAGRGNITPIAHASSMPGNGAMHSRLHALGALFLNVDETRSVLEILIHELPRYIQVPEWCE